MTNEHTHTSKQFDAELEALRARVLQMGGFVEQQITLAVEALSLSDLEMCSNIVANDHKVNAMEVGIDEDCSTIIARRQPAASDLRLIMMVVKTITDLERIGDEAAKIARMAKLINSVDRVQQPRYVEIRRMAGSAIEMLRKSLDCFARLDVTGSAEVVRHRPARRRRVPCHPAPAHHLHDGRSADHLALRSRSCSSPKRWSASAITPRTSPNT